MKTILKFLLVLAAIAFAANVPVENPVVTLSVYAIAFAIVTALVVPARYFAGNELNAVTAVKVWNKYIIEKLRKTNAFLMFSRDESRYVLGGATVYIPQAGSDPSIEVNTSTFPLTPAQREDSDVNYTLDVFRTIPSHVSWEELQTISYDKLDSVLGMHGSALADKVADKMLINWAPTVAGKQIATSGDDVDPITGQTGNRKGFHHNDLKRAMVALNVANVPKNGRKALIDDNMFEYFYDSLTTAQFNAFNQYADNANGIVGRIHGFDVMTRSSVLQYAAAGTSPDALGAALDETDNLASLVWQEDMVCRAIGDTKLFTDRDNPLYQGDLFSAIMRAGGRKVREDNNGVIAIVQGTN